MPIIMFLPLLSTNNSSGPVPIAIQDHDSQGPFFVPWLVLGRKGQVLLYQNPSLFQKCQLLCPSAWEKISVRMGSGWLGAHSQGSNWKPKESEKKKTAAWLFLISWRTDKKSQALSSMKSYWDNRDGIATADSNVYKGMMCRCCTAWNQQPRLALWIVTRGKISHLGQIGIVPPKITSQV